MYCQNCGTEIPEGGGFCSECGKPVNAPLQQESSISPGSVLNIQNPKPKLRNPHTIKSLAGVAAGVLALVIVGIAVFAFVGRLAESQGVRIPTLEEVEKKVNSIDSDKIRFEESGFEDGFFIYLDDNLVGWMYLKDYQPQCIGLGINKGKTDDGQPIFEQVSVGIIEACDPSLGLDGAKKLTNEIASNYFTGGTVECDGVIYTPSLSETEYELLITVPDECVNRN